MTTTTVRPVRSGPPPRQVNRAALRWLVGAAVAVLVVAAVWVVAFSSVLGVRTVKVEGTHRLSAATVRAAAAITSGTPLLRLSRDAVERRVEALPDVRTATVSVSYPSTVVIAITERTAAGYLQTAAKTWVLVDEQGRQFTTVHVRPKGILLLQPSAAVAGDTATLAALAQVAVSLPAPVRAALASISATGPEAVTLTLKDQRTVFWGGSERSVDKARVLPALLRRPGSQYDVSDPDLVVAR